MWCGEWRVSCTLVGEGCLPGCQPLASRRRPATAASASTGVLCLERPGLDVGRVLSFDIQGWITLILGGLLALITLFSSYNHVHVPFVGTVALDQQVGVLLLIALVPALFGVAACFSEGVAELATRRRLRAERDRVQEEAEATAERERAAEVRRRAAEDRARAADETAQERDRSVQERVRADRERNRAAVAEVGRRPWSENTRLAELDARIASLWPVRLPAQPQRRHPTTPRRPDRPSARIR
jgi:hypothetical protein